MRTLRRNLNDPNTAAYKVFEWSSVGMIVVALGTVPIEASPEWGRGWQWAVSGLELGILGFFTAEYLLRLWIADRPWTYVFSKWGLIDLTAILPFYLALGADMTALRGLRLLRIVRLWKSRRYTQAWVRLAKALKESSEEAVLFFTASALVLYIAAVGIHQFESAAQPEHFGTLGKSFWWALGLLVDVEYGEIWPATTGGKAFTAVIALVGIAVVAVPAGMVASALTKVANEQRQDAQARKADDTNEK